MTTWRIPTKRDRLPPEAGNPMLRCDGCPRRAAADMLRDVRALPAALRGRTGTAEYLCDVCMEVMIGRGRVAREDVVRLMGAPAAVVTAIQGWALKHDPIRRTKVTIALPRP